MHNDLSSIVGATIVKAENRTPCMGWPRIILDDGREVMFIADYCGEVDAEISREETTYDS